MDLTSPSGYHLASGLLLLGVKFLHRRRVEYAESFVLFLLLQLSLVKCLLLPLLILFHLGLELFSVLLLLQLLVMENLKWISLKDVSRRRQVVSRHACSACIVHHLGLVRELPVLRLISVLGPAD